MMTVDGISCIVLHTSLTAMTKEVVQMALEIVPPDKRCRRLSFTHFHVKVHRNIALYLMVLNLFVMQTH